MNGFERRKQGKMERVYTAAFQLIMKYGYSKVSVNEIAEKARVSPATIYNYFGTKEQLYTETLHYWMDKQIVEYEKILYSERSYPEKIKEIMLNEAKNLKTLSYSANQSLDSEIGALGMIKTIGEKKLLQFFVKLLTLGKQEGYIQAIYPDEMIQRYFAMYMNEVSQLSEKDSQDETGKQIDQFLELFFYGLIGAKP